MKLVTGIVRTTALARIVQALEHIGIRGMTISEVKGLGEEVRLNGPYSIHDRIEIIAPDEKIDLIVRTVLEQGRVGLAGDGVVFVTSLDHAVKIRTGDDPT